MARGYANLQFHWNDSASNIIHNLGFGRELNKEAAKILYENAYEYIPYSLQESMGSLADRVRITATDDHATITHLVPYANRQYYADAGSGNGKDVGVHRTRVIHPLATSRWYDWAWKMKKGEITKEIDEARLKYRKPTVSSAKDQEFQGDSTPLSGDDWFALLLALITGGVK